MTAVLTAANTTWADVVVAGVILACIVAIVWRDVRR